VQRLFSRLSAVLLVAGCAAPPGPAKTSLAAVAQAGPCAPGGEPLALGRPLVVSSAPLGNPVSASCARSGAPSCQFRFDVSQPSDLRVALSSIEFDGALALFASPPAADARRARTVEVACVDDTPLGDTQHARLDVSLEPGSYMLAVVGGAEREGEFELFAELEPLPAQALLCRQAEVLRPGVHQRGSTRGGASSFRAGCGGRGAGPDQVYRVALAQPARVRVRSQSEFDASLSLRDQCELPGSELSCSAASPGGQPMVNAELAPGDYFLVVDGATRGEGGDFVLALETAPVPAPLTEEQACAAATPVRADGARHELDTFYATSTSASSCGGQGAPDTALTFRLASAGTLTLYVSDFEFDPVFSLRRACEYIESELACVPWVRPPGSEALGLEHAALSMSLPAGDYALMVDGKTPSSMGAGSVRLSFVPEARAAALSSAARSGP
jgi:hypothetical protein